MGFRVVFFGTPAFAVPTLERIAASAHTVAAVVTQPDRPRGRGQRVAPPPIKVVGTRLGVPVLQPTRLKRDETFYEALDEARADIGVVAAYGRILPPRLLDHPRHGMVNVHASLLPRWRGAAPVARAVLAGDTVTGVTIMRVVPALDAGPMLARTRVAIDPNETSGELEARLSVTGATLLVETLDRLAEGPVDEEAQDEAQVTYAARLERSDSAVDWARTATDLHNQVRGLQPWPQAAAWLRGRRVLLRRSELIDLEVGDAEPGTIVALAGEACDIATGSNAIRILEVQPEGRSAMSARALLNGQRIAPGETFDPAPPARP